LLMNPHYECKSARLFEWIVTKRDENALVVGAQPLVWRSRRGPEGRHAGHAGESSQGHIFVLHAISQPSHVAVVKIVPKSGCDFLDTLDVARSGARGPNGIEVAASS